MTCSLALARGVLYVGTQAKTARVQSFDLAGRELGTTFGFRDALAGRSSVGGLAVDEDRTLWVADTPADRVRVFTLFGREVGGIGARSPAGAGADEPVLPGLISAPVDVEVRGNRDGGWVAIACGGERRGAVQVFGLDLSWRSSCASLGEPQRSFLAVSRLASRGEDLFVVESGARRVQVFRAGRFLFSFQLNGRDGAPCEPSALAPLCDGRLVLGCRGPRSGLFLLDPSGRVLRQLADEGEREGSVLEPSDVVVEPAEREEETRIVVGDLAGTRVQVLDLEGRCRLVIPLDQAPASAARRPGKKKGGR